MSETIFETMANNREDLANVEIAVDSVKKRIIEKNNDINAVIWQDQIFIDKEIDNVKNMNNNVPLFGLPILVKELDGTIKGTPNSHGNKVLKDLNINDTYTSTSIRLLQEAGVVIVGKTNNPEFGLNVTTNSSAHGSCRNPHDLSLNSGGSSGGSAAAVASGMVRVATGGDGGGSIRIPAAHCGVFGYKSSRGRISYGPIIGQAWAGLVSKGLLGASVKEIALVADVMTKQQSGDPYNAHPYISEFYNCIQSEMPKLKIGIRTQAFGNSCEVSKVFINATNSLGDFLSDQGHDVSMDSPSTYNEDWILQTFNRIIATNTESDFKEISKRTNGALKLDDCDASAQYFINESKRITGGMYVDACYEMEYFTNQTAPFFDDYDVLITPTVSDFAPKISDQELKGITPYNPYTYAGFTAPINFIGGCAFSLPISTKESHLPIGIQIASKRDNDHLIFQFSHYLECYYPNIYSNIAF